MLSNQITTHIAQIQSGIPSAPLLLSEAHVCEILSLLFDQEIEDISTLSFGGLTDVYLYDCGDRDNELHKVGPLREFVQKLYQKPQGDILVAIFHHLDILREETSAVLLRLFEDVPKSLCILITSQSPQKLLPTIVSRIIVVDGETALKKENPLWDVVQEYLEGRPEKIFSLTLKSSKEWKFSREDALWVIQGLQDGIQSGILPTRHAKRIVKTRLQLETTNTIPKYLIDALLISLACD